MQVASPSGPPPRLSPNHTRALAVLTSLFFMWGFLTC